MGFWLGYLFGRAVSDYESAPGDARAPGDGYILPDERARQYACAQLADAGLDSSEIEVRVLSGELTLEGSVRDERMKMRAEALCKGIPGVAHVHNALAVRNER